MTHLDEPDRFIISALHVCPRASWGHIARALDMPESIVARRAQKLLSSKQVSVIGVAESSRGRNALTVVVRLACRPGTTERVAAAVAAETAVRFVTITTGAEACVAEVVAPNREMLLAVLDGKLGTIEGVTSIAAQLILKTFSNTYEWVPAGLPDATLARLRAGIPPHAPREPHEPAFELNEQEGAIVETLRRDGRASLVDLAAASQSSQSTVRRRIDALVERGILHFRLLVEPSMIGFGAEVVFWLSADPASVAGIAASLSANPALRYLTATTGRTTIFGNAVLRSADDLHQFTCDIIGTFQPLADAEVQLVLKPVKRHWHVLRP